MAVIADLELGLQVLQLFLTLSHLPVGMAQLQLHLIEVSFHLFLSSQGIIPTPDLRLQSAVQGINGPLSVSLQLVNLFVLLSNFPVHL